MLTINSIRNKISNVYFLSRPKKSQKIKDKERQEYLKRTQTIDYNSSEYSNFYKAYINALKPDDRKFFEESEEISSEEIPFSQLDEELIAPDYFNRITE